MSVLLKRSVASFSCTSPGAVYSSSGSSGSGSLLRSMSRAASFTSGRHGAALTSMPRGVAAAPPTMFGYLSNQIQGSSTFTATDKYKLPLTGTFNGIMPSATVALLGGDGYGFRGDRIVQEDVAKVFSFEYDENLSKILMMYGGNPTVPGLIWHLLHCLPGNVSAESCGLYIKGWMEEVMAKYDGNPPEFILDRNKFRVSFASIKDGASLITHYDGVNGKYEIVREPLFIGKGSGMAYYYYYNFVRANIDGVGLFGDVFESYMNDYNEYSLMDIMLYASLDEAEPNGGKLLIKKATADGTQDVWNNWSDMLSFERDIHWMAEAQRLKMGLINSVSPIEWCFDHAEASRLKRGVINKVTFRLHQRYKDYIN